MHGEKEMKEGHAPNTNQNSSKAGTSVPSEETDAVSSIVSEPRKPTHSGKTAPIKPTLEDLGKFLSVIPSCISSSEHSLVGFLSLFFLHFFFFLLQSFEIYIYLVIL